MSEKTQWHGLWYQREGVYSGYVIKKSDIPEKARLILRYNKYYDKGSNKPRFVYCFANGDSADAITMQVEHEEYVSLEDLTSKIEELAEIMRQGNCNADMMMLPSQSAASAESLMEKAIDIIEELTGEEWNFTYITY